MVKPASSSWHTAFFRCARRGSARLPGLRKLGRDDGATIVETTIALMLVIMPMLFGCIEVCLGLYAYHFTSDAAREATRWAIVRGSQCSTNTPGLDHCNAAQSDIQTYVRGLGYPGANTLTVTASWMTATTTTNASNQTTTTWSACTTGTCNAPGNIIQVKVTYPYTMSIFSWKSAAININSNAAMVVAQ
jgi:Flp pilus assembly protein TadG